jgi:hypothetical protein
MQILQAKRLWALNFLVMRMSRFRDLSHIRDVCQLHFLFVCCERCFSHTESHTTSKGLYFSLKLILCQITTRIITAGVYGVHLVIYFMSVSQITRNVNWQDDC